MSAFIVSKRHVDALIAAGLSRKIAGRYGPFRWFHDGVSQELRIENADEVGQMLWSENVASVEHRYPDSPNLPGSYVRESPAPGIAEIELPEWIVSYRHDHARAPRLTPVGVLKAIDCYEYQSCEHAEWGESMAHAFCDALRRATCHALPGYDDAEWGL